jgi:two-component system chemotaxis sensor kinase CheA
MNDLLASFVTEARDLLVEAGEDLLALERAPQDEAAINRLFRSVHTLKGSSGLFDVAPLTRLLHAAEDLFQAVREQGFLLTPDVVDMVLQVLDQTGHWIDHLALHETLPANAVTVAKTLVTELRAKFGRRPGEPLATLIAERPVQAPPPGLESWFSAELRQTLAQSASCVHLVSYVPEEGCFFKGEDPLYLVLQIPHLQALTCEPRLPWGPLAALDPFSCNLGLHALTTAGRDALDALFRYVPEQVTITRLGAAALVGAAGAAAPDAALRAAPGPAVTEPAGLAEAMLAEQIAVLDCVAPEDDVPGRAAAAARVVRNALLSCGRDLAVPAIDAAAVAAAATGLAAPLRQAIEAALAAMRQATAATMALAAAPEPAPAAAPMAARTLRVDQSRIDTMMSLVGELIVAKNSLPFLARRAEHQFGSRELGRDIKEQYGVIDHIAQELQGAIMAVRMMPIGQVFQRFPRLVRDLSRKLGKQVDLVIEGEATEADKNVIETLFDPLLHMVRNSLDHGIETPEQRTACGKPASATLKLLARQESDQVVIEIVDDGRGIDPALIKRKALSRGLIDAQRLQTIGDDEARMLVFAAGFSTAETLSDVSGRGVGMDVVRNAVERAGGRIALTSETGHGTTVRLHLPLSMAVSRVMTVALHERLFGIPMDLIRETVRLPRETILRIKASEAFVLRDSVVPLLRLDRLLAMPGPVDAPGDEPADEPGDVAVLVVRARGQTVGLCVSAFGEGLDVIVKPMEGMLSNIAGYSGTALLGDGRVLLVLDLKELMP